MDVEGLKSLKVRGIMADQAACGHFRIYNPFMYLQKMGYDAQVLSQGFSRQQMRDCDIIVVQRMYDPQICKDLLEMKAEGKTLIYELDDNLHSVHRNSPAWEAYKPGGENIKWVTRMLQEANGVTLSTVDLAADYLKYNGNTYVIENQIDYALRDWSNPIPRTDDRLVVGWTGGAQHQEDMAFMSTWLKDAIMPFDHVKFVICTNLDIARDFCEDMCELPEDKYEVIKPREFALYPPIISHFDIGLAPIIPSMFNRSKSALKNLEQGAWGVATVASKFAPYVRWDAGREDILIVENTPTAWIEAVRELVENSTLRQKMQASIKERVFKEHNMADHTLEWAYAWADARSRAQSGETAPRREMDMKPGRNSPCPCGSGLKYKNCSCFGAFG